MAADYQKGRADASKGKFDPPTHGFAESKTEWDRKDQRIQEYREGYYDKRREMGRSN